MKDNKMHLGFSPLTGKIYLGRQKGDCWVGEKRDVTSEFLQVMEQKFPINTTQSVTVDGEDKFRVIVVDMEKTVAIDGKELEK